MYDADDMCVHLYSHLNFCCASAVAAVVAGDVYYIFFVFVTDSIAYRIGLLNVSLEKELLGYKRKFMSLSFSFFFLFSYIIFG